MRGSEDKPASFIGKLCNMLRVLIMLIQSKQNAKAIVWDPLLKGIRIVNEKRLAEAVLPRYYRHNRFSSFVRQLNMYDFHKVQLDDERAIFVHANFNPKT